MELSKEHGKAKLQGEKQELEFFVKMMEEMAGKPEERYIRQPGERNSYEMAHIRAEKLAGEISSENSTTLAPTPE